MGIPRFFRYISSNFPECCSEVKECPPIDNLYLDANGIIHNSSRKIYFPDRRKLTTSTSAETKEKALFNEICDYIDNLLKFVRPRQTLYIAIDGCAPIAKQTQQRQRRYKAAAMKTAQELATFDSTCITPGTRFMYELHKHLQWYIQKMMSVDKQWQRVRVIYSGPQTPGEGEHKIVESIRRDPARANKIHCMYGLDADLFMLGLSTGCEKFYLLREGDPPNIFYLVDLGKLRELLWKRWGGELSHQQLVREFIFICFLVGNDFLHASPSFADLAESIPFVMDLRASLLGRDTLIDNSGRIQLGNFKRLLQKLSETEAAAISAQFYKQQYAPNLTLNTSLKDKQHPELGIDFEKYRELYYKKCKDPPEKLCKDYIQGLDWVNWYYYNTPNNWQWYYPHHYTPLLDDLVRFLDSGEKLSQVSVVKSAPVIPFFQLLCVVPPISKGLLPQFLQELYEKLPYFPKEFKIDYDGKQQEWEGIAQLPFIDVTHLKGEYDKAEKRANETGVRTVFARNGVEPSMVYWFSGGPKFSKIC